MMAEMKHNIEEQRNQHLNMATMQQKIVRYVPELDSKHAAFPMEHENWLAPNGKAPDGAPGFVEGPNNGRKQDYVYARGLNGPGYYHVLTKYAHVAAYEKFMNAGHVSCCSSFLRTSEYDEWDSVRLVLHARTRAARANDFAAKKSQMNEAMGTAVAMGNVFFHNPKDRDEYNQKAKH